MIYKGWYAIKPKQPTNQSERSNQMTRVDIDWLYPTVHAKDQVLGNILAGTFSNSFRQNLSSH